MNDDFVDSNVFLYEFDIANHRKREIAVELIGSLIDENRGCISFQVVQEVLNGMTRGFRRTATSSDAKQFLSDVLVPLWIVMPEQRLYERAVDVRERYAYSFYDSLIIASALEAGCTRLFSEDMQDGQRIERLTIVNPFATA